MNEVGVSDFLGGMITPRPEHPRPQFEREGWKNLNGVWTFAFDFGRSGAERGFPASTGFPDPIVVPFCPESELSGVHYRDFIDALWYHRKIVIPYEWHEHRILLHFGGVDYESEIFVDGKHVAHHSGGSSSFSCDITPFVTPGEMHDLVVHAVDALRSGTQTGGKQSLEYGSVGCFYSRITGIWQTVWLEAVSPFSLSDLTMVPDLRSGCVVMTPQYLSASHTHSLVVTVYDGDTEIAQCTRPAVQGTPFAIPLESPHPWSPSDPHLYTTTAEVKAADGRVVDSVKSYFGMRSVEIEGNQLLLNGEPLYLRFVLDQGYYQDGLWTAPSDAALKTDIKLALEAGFNGARLHQKVFEERFHYWADRLGYLTWAESPSWGLDIKNPAGARNFLNEWREVVLRDRNHPSIIAWTTLNETWDISNRAAHRRLHQEAYDITRALDPTRPINNASGGCHVCTDLYTVHIYEQDPYELAAKLAPDELGGVFRTLGDKEVHYEGQPYIIDEFGGIKWVGESSRIAQHSWGYGEAPRTIEEFYRRLEGQVGAILRLSHAAGYCYTQLTDVEQEQNGLYHYDRSLKFEIERIRAIFSRHTINQA